MGYVANVGTHNRYLVPPINRGPTFWGAFECSIQLRNDTDTRKRHAALSDLTSKSCIAFDFQSFGFMVLHSGFLSIQTPLIKDVSRFVCVYVSQELWGPTTACHLPWVKIRHLWDVYVYTLSNILCASSYMYITILQYIICVYIVYCIVFSLLNHLI